MIKKGNMTYNKISLLLLFCCNTLCAPLLSTLTLSNTAATETPFLIHTITTKNLFSGRNTTTPSTTGAVMTKLKSTSTNLAMLMSTKTATEMINSEETTKTTHTSTEAMVTSTVTSLLEDTAIPLTTKTATKILSSIGTTKTTPTSKESMITSMESTATPTPTMTITSSTFINSRPPPSTSASAPSLIPSLLSASSLSTKKTLTEKPQSSSKLTFQTFSQNDKEPQNDSVTSVLPDTTVSPETTNTLLPDLNQKTRTRDISIDHLTTLATETEQTLPIKPSKNKVFPDTTASPETTTALLPDLNKNTRTSDISIDHMTTPSTETEQTLPMRPLKTKFLSAINNFNQQNSGTNEAQSWHLFRLASRRQRIMCRRACNSFKRFRYRYNCHSSSRICHCNCCMEWRRPFVNPSYTWYFEY